MPHKLPNKTNRKINPRLHVRSLNEIINQNVGIQKSFSKYNGFKERKEESIKKAIKIAKLRAELIGNLEQQKEYGAFTTSIIQNILY